MHHGCLFLLWTFFTHNKGTRQWNWTMSPPLALIYWSRLMICPWLILDPLSVYLDQWTSFCWPHLWYPKQDHRIELNNVTPPLFLIYWTLTMICLIDFGSIVSLSGSVLRDSGLLFINHICNKTTKRPDNKTGQCDSSIVNDILN